MDRRTTRLIAIKALHENGAQHRLLLSRPGLVFPKCKQLVVRVSCQPIGARLLAIQARDVTQRGGVTSHVSCVPLEGHERHAVRLFGEVRYHQALGKISALFSSLLLSKERLKTATQHLEHLQTLTDPGGIRGKCPPPRAV